MLFNMLPVNLSLSEFVSVTIAVLISARVFFLAAFARPVLHVMQWLSAASILSLPAYVEADFGNTKLIFFFFFIFLYIAFRNKCT